MSALVAPASMEVSVKSGRVEVRSGDVEAPTVVKGQAHIDANGIVHSKSSGSLVLACPPGTNLVIGTQSGSVTCAGEFGSVMVSCQSGTIDIGACRHVEVRTMSGSIHIGPVAGDCRVSTMSGRVEIAAARRANVTTASGRVTIGGVHDCSVHSATGRAVIVCDGPGDVDVKTISGSIDISYPGGFAPQVVSASRGAGRIVDRLRKDVPRQGTARVASTAGSITLRHG